MTTGNNGAAAIIGLGNMGYPMAGHLVKAGYGVTVFNRTAAKAERWAKEYGALSRKRRRRPPRAPTSSSPASATTTTCAASPSAKPGFLQD